MLTFNLKKEWFEKIKSGEKRTNIVYTLIIGVIGCYIENCLVIVSLRAATLQKMIKQED